MYISGRTVNVTYYTICTTIVVGGCLVKIKWIIYIKFIFNIQCHVSVQCRHKFNVSKHTVKLNLSLTGF